MRAHPTRGLLLLLVPLLLGGGAAALPAQRPASRVLTWPVAPEAPRVRYVGSLNSERDIGRSESFFARLRATVAGASRDRAIAMERPFDVHVIDGRRFYVTNGALRAILVFDQDRKRARALGEDVPGGLLKPMGLGGDARGAVFVADAGLRRVVAFDPAGKYHRMIGGPALLLNPVDVAVDPSGQRIYVVDSYLHQLLVFDSSGVLLARTGRDAGSLSAAERRRSAATVHGEVTAAGTGALSPSVADSGRAAAPDSGIAAVHASFERVGSSDVWENRGGEPGEFRYPVAVAVGPDGAVYVSDQMNFRIQVFDRDGRFLRAFGHAGDTPGSFARPKGVAVDGQGHVYVVDAAFNNVQVFDGAGDLLLAFGSLGHGEGEHWLPMGLAIDGRDRIYVADRFNNRVQVYEYLGEPAPPPAGAPGKS